MQIMICNNKKVIGNTAGKHSVLVFYLNFAIILQKK